MSNIKVLHQFTEVSAAAPGPGLPQKLCCTADSKACCTCKDFKTVRTTETLNTSIEKKISDVTTFVPQCLQPNHKHFHIEREILWNLMRSNMISQFTLGNQAKIIRFVRFPRSVIWAGLMSFWAENLSLNTAHMAWISDQIIFKAITIIWM